MNFLGLLVQVSSKTNSSCSCSYSCVVVDFMVVIITVIIIIIKAVILVTLTLKNNSYGGLYKYTGSVQTDVLNVFLSSYSVFHLF